MSTAVPVDGTLVLCYHNIVSDDIPPELREAQLALPASGFAGQLRFLLNRHKVVTFDDIERRTGVRNGLVLTFDDGYRGVLEFAGPLVARHGIPAYIFINPAFVGGWNPRDKLMALALYGSPAAVREVEAWLGVTMTDGDLRARARRFVAWRTQMWRAIAARGAGSAIEIDTLFTRYADEQIIGRLAPSRLLSWDELIVLRQQGFRIGNHAQRHLELDTVPREVVRSEVREAQHAIRQMLGDEDPVISYPRGKTGPAVLEEVAAAGYRWGLTASPGRIHDRRPSLMTPRVLIPPTPGIPDLIWRTSRFRLWARRQAKHLVG